MSTEQNITISQLRKQVAEFVSERNWEKYHTPKNLAESISIESAELLEEFQWKTVSEIDRELGGKSGKIESVKEEIADVIIYCLSLANELDIDLGQAVEEKIKLNRKKYPPGETNS